MVFGRTIPTSTFSLNIWLVLGTTNGRSLQLNTVVLSVDSVLAQLLVVKTMQLVTQTAFVAQTLQGLEFQFSFLALCPCYNFVHSPDSMHTRYRKIQPKETNLSFKINSKGSPLQPPLAPDAELNTKVPDCFPLT